MKRKNNTGKLVGIALMMALVLVMQTLGGIIPPVGGFSISLVLIPVVLGAAIFGPGAGALLGATFGVIVFINCVTGADPGGAMVFQANPVLCFLVVMAKGTLAGFASGWVYKLLRGKNTYVAMLLAAIVCPVINTGVFVACMLLFFVDVLAAWAGGGDLLGYVLTGLILANFVPELIINIVFSPAGERICGVVNRKKA
ncbi:MAG: ECF transporter S component [Oscillospiraceae bacterium]|nr:ECF transporter S component [Oscillospiraceae bacterium]